MIKINVLLEIDLEPKWSESIVVSNLEATLRNIVSSYPTTKTAIITYTNNHTIVIKETN